MDIGVNQDFVLPNEVCQQIAQYIISCKCNYHYEIEFGYDEPQWLPHKIFYTKLINYYQMHVNDDIITSDKTHIICGLDRSNFYDKIQQMINEVNDDEPCNLHGYQVDAEFVNNKISFVTDHYNETDHMLNISAHECIPIKKEEILQILYDMLAWCDNYCQEHRI